MATWQMPLDTWMMHPPKKRPGSLFPTSRAVILATSYSRTTYRRTTIGAAAFHFRVRNGNGWGHCAMITRRLVKPKLARGGLDRGGLSSTSPEILGTQLGPTDGFKQLEGIQSPVSDCLMKEQGVL